jgi:predicted Zn-dependent protease
MSARSQLQACTLVPALVLGTCLLTQACASAPKPTLPVTPAAANRSTAEHYVAEGMSLARAGDLVRAEQYLASAWRIDGRDPRILRTLLHICIGASRLGAAATYAQAYLLAHPHAWPLRFVLASIDLALHRTDDAREELQHVIEDHPEHADAYFLLATLERAGGNQTDARRSLYDRYLVLAPNGSHALEARRLLQTQLTTEVGR